MFRNLVLRNRSYRRFDESLPLSDEILRELVDLARCCPSAGNLQPLRYIVCAGTQRCGRVFETLAWAGYLTDWPYSWKPR